MTQYAEITSDSITSQKYEVLRESPENMDVESSSQLPPVKVEKNVAYLAQTYGEEGGKYEVVEPQAPAKTSTESAPPHVMSVNVAYGATRHMM